MWIVLNRIKKINSPQRVLKIISDARIDHIIYIILNTIVIIQKFCNMYLKLTSFVNSNFIMKIDKLTADFRNINNHCGNYFHIEKMEY